MFRRLVSLFVTTTFLTVQGGALSPVPTPFEASKLAPATPLSIKERARSFLDELNEEFEIGFDSYRLAIQRMSVRKATDADIKTFIGELSSEIAEKLKRLRAKMIRQPNAINLKNYALALHKTAQEFHQKTGFGAGGVADLHYGITLLNLMNEVNKSGNTLFKRKLQKADRQKQRYLQAGGGTKKKKEERFPSPKLPGNGLTPPDLTNLTLTPLPASPIPSKPKEEFRTFRDDYVEAVSLLSPEMGQVSLALARLYLNQFNNTNRALPYVDTAREFLSPTTSVNKQEIFLRIQTLLTASDIQMVFQIIAALTEAKIFDFSNSLILACIQGHQFEKAEHLIKLAMKGNLPQKEVESYQNMLGLLRMEEGRKLYFEGASPKEYNPKFIEARDIFSSLIGEDGTSHTGAVRNYAEALHWLKDYTAILKLIKRYDGNSVPMVLYMFGSFVALDNQLHDQLFAMLEKVAKFDAFNPYVYTHLFAIFMRLGLVDEAFDAFLLGFEFSSEGAHHLPLFFQLPEVPLEIRAQAVTKLLKNPKTWPVFSNTFEVLIDRPQYGMLQRLVEPVLVRVSESKQHPKAATRAKELLSKGRDLVWGLEEIPAEYQVKPGKEKTGAATDSSHWIHAALKMDIDGIVKELSDILATEKSSGKKKRKKTTRKQPRLSEQEKGIARFIRKVNKRDYVGDTSDATRTDDYAAIVILTNGIGGLTWERTLQIIEYGYRLLDEGLDIHLGVNTDSFISPDVFVSKPDEKVVQAFSEMMHDTNAALFWNAMAQGWYSLIENFYFRNHYDEAKKASDKALVSFESFLERNPNAFDHGLSSASIYENFALIAIRAATLTPDKTKKIKYYGRALEFLKKMQPLLERLEDSLLVLMKDESWLKLISSTKGVHIANLYMAAKIQVPLLRRQYHTSSVKILKQFDGDEFDEAIQQRADAVLAKKEVLSHKNALMNAEVLSLLGRDQEVVDLITGYLSNTEREPGDRLELMHLLAETLYHMDKKEAALTVFYRLFLLVPDNAFSIVNVLVLLLQQADLSKEETKNITRTLFGFLLNVAQTEENKQPTPGSISLPKDKVFRDKLSFPEEERVIRNAYFTEFFTNIYEGLFQFKEIDEEFFMSMVNDVLTGPDLAAEAFTLFLKKTDKADWNILDLLNEVKIHKPKVGGKGKRAKEARRQYEQAVERLESWKKIIRERVNTEEPKKRQEWLKEALGNVPEELAESLYAEIESPLSLNKEDFIQKVERGLVERLARDYPYLSGEDRKVLRIAVRDGVEPFSAFESEEVALFERLWPNLKAKLPELIKEAKRPMKRPKLVLIDPALAGEEIPLNTNHLADWLTLSSVEEYLLNYLPPLKAALLQSKEDADLLEQALELTKFSVLMINGTREKAKDKYTYNNIRESFLADVIRNFFALKYDFLGEELLGTQDFISLIHTANGEEPRLSDLHGKVMNLSLKKLEEIFPFYTKGKIKNSEAILDIMFDSDLTAQQAHVQLAQRVKVKVVPFESDSLTGFRFYLVVNLRAPGMGGIHLYFPPFTKEVSVFDDNNGVVTYKGTQRKDIAREVAQREAEILSALKKIKGSKYEPFTTLTTNYGSLSIFENMDNWPVFVRSSGKTLEKEIGPEIKPVLAQAIYTGTQASIEYPEGTKHLRFLPLKNKDGEMRVVTVDLDKKDHLVTARVEEPKTFLDNLLLLDWHSRNEFNVIKEVLERKGSRIFISRSFQKGILYYQNQYRDNIWGLQFIKRQGADNAELISLGNDNPEEALIDLSFVLALAQQQEEASGADDPTSSGRQAPQNRIPPYLISFDTSHLLNSAI